jgi:hypothetical protein
MDPLTIGLQAVGIGMQIFGAMGASSNAHKAADINKGIAGDEMQINAQKQIQMEMSARRQQMEIMRQAQQKGAQATAAATNQGAQFGSGLQGGLAQVQDQAGFNSQGVTGNLAIGENIFGINNDISNKKMQLSDVQSSQATDQAWASLGGSIVSNAGTIGNIGKFASKGFSLGSSGNYSGTPGASNTGGLY